MRELGIKLPGEQALIVEMKLHLVCEPRANLLSNGEKH